MRTNRMSAVFSLTTTGSFSLTVPLELHDFDVTLGIVWLGKN